MTKNDIKILKELFIKINIQNANSAESTITLSEDDVINAFFEAWQLSDGLIDLNNEGDHEKVKSEDYENLSGMNYEIGKYSTGITVNLNEMEFVEQDASILWMYMENYFEAVEGLMAFIDGDYLNFTNTDMDQPGAVRQKNYNRVRRAIHQKETLIRNFMVMKEIGFLKASVEQQNETITAINEVLSDENKFEFLTEEKVLDYVRGLDATNPEELNYILLMNRHFLNKLGHNFELIVALNLCGQIRSENEFEEELQIVANEVLSILQDNSLSKDEKKQRLKPILTSELEIKNYDTYFEKLNKIQERSTPEKFIQTFTKDVKVKIKHKPFDYSVECINKFSTYKKEYEKTCRVNNITPLKFSEFVRKIFDGEVLESEIEASDVLKQIKTHIGSLEARLNFANRRDAILELCEGIEKEEKFMKAKHYATTLLLGEYFNGKSNIYIDREGYTNETGVTNIYLNGSTQVWSVHNKLFEPIAKDPRIDYLKFVNPNIPLGFYKKTGHSFCISAPMPLVTPSQQEEFKKLSQTVKYLDGKLSEPVSEDSLLKLDLLKCYKTQEPEKYNVLRTKILLGAGVEEFKEYYGIDDSELIHEYNEWSRKLNQYTRFFHDRKSDSYFAERSFTLNGLAGYVRYSAAQREGRNLVTRQNIVDGNVPDKDED